MVINHIHRMDIPGKFHVTVEILYYQKRLDKPDHFQGYIFSINSFFD